ncbi:MAG TPA: cytochrome c [Blastocatellia bacterium]|nr:cytochrome c [Blastocatellia bacterium]
MLRGTHTHTWFIVAVALLVALTGAACKSESVVSDSSAQNVSASPANSLPSATQTAGTPPATAPTTAASPDGGNSQSRKIVSNIPATVTAAKPPATPEPDPYPPRPEPTVVMKDGKIVQQWQAPADAANLTNPMKSNPDTAKMGREFYLQVCAACHGKSGQGNGINSNFPKRDGKPLPPTNLTSKVVQANTDGELFWKITNGKSPMPAHRIRLDDEQRWHIVSYIRTLKK